MDPIAILEKFGVPIAFCLGLAWFIYKQNKYIQDDLTKDLKERFERLEGIVIKLIDQQKIMQIELGKITSKYNALVTIITKMIRKNETK
jgi:chaperonin cofactor prefoldin